MMLKSSFVVLLFICGCDSYEPVSVREIDNDPLDELVIGDVQNGMNCANCGVDYVAVTNDGVAWCLCSKCLYMPKSPDYQSPPKKPLVLIQTGEAVVPRQR